MSVQYVMDAQNGVVCSTFTGLLTSDDLRDHAVNLGKDPKFKSTFRELADLTTATDVNLGSMFVASSVSFDPFSQKSKRAFVVPPQGPVLAWTRMMGSLRENPNIQVFTSMEEARKWLGMP